MTDQDRDPSTGPTSRRSRLRDDHLNSTAELVQAGGNRGALGIMLYLVIGTAFWGLIGFLLDYLVGTEWIVFLGAGIGLAAGIALSYLRLQSGLRTTDDPQDDDGAARNRRNAPYPTSAQRGGHGGSRKDRP
ncbi:hypothetical protein [Kocuria palustris]|uniref:hypothetical protein n=1 Tax=Kocuria palustris TaxID=71999 RepID=UPI00164290FB|nr:hypothetical protein [Kocuria palustris]